MYTVNNTNFFDYGVNAGDTWFRVGYGLRVFLLSTPIQFFGTPQSELIVSHAPMHTLTYTQGHGCYIYYEHISWYCPILFCTILKIQKFKLNLTIISTISKFRQHILQTFINKFASFCLKIDGDA